MAYIDLQTISVASPCSAEWADMTGNDNVRHCADCQKNVYNLSSLTHAEISDLILEKEGNLCIRFYRRHDGTMLTADCPKGLRTVRRGYLSARTKLISSVIALCSYLGMSIAPHTSSAMQGVPLPMPSVDTTHHHKKTHAPDTTTHAKTQHRVKVIKKKS